MTQTRNYVDYYLIIPFIIVIIVIVFYFPNDLISKFILVSPYLVLLINQISRQALDLRKETKEQNDLIKNIELYGKNLIEWTEGLHIHYFKRIIERDTDLYGRYFGVLILYRKEFDSFEDEQTHATDQHCKTNTIFKLFILEGSYTIELFENEHGMYEIMKRCEFDETNMDLLKKRMEQFCKNKFDLIINLDLNIDSEK